MNKSDFEFDADLFKKEFGVTKFAMKGALEKFLELVRYCEEISQDFLGGAVSFIATPEKNRVDGEIIGKKFSILYAGLAQNRVAVVEAVVTIQELLTGRPVEVCRFLLLPDGSIASNDGEKLIDGQESDYTYRILVAIARRVMYASSIS
ncbi:MAG: hypothetical protein K0S85_4771 [Pseudomonas orientalis]|nr:hypothetical protein [Pseudomonas orientalis]